jgi:DNA end-binding protein Ku
MATVWRGYLTFGLVSIPVRLHKAARAEKVSFRMLHREARAPEPEPDLEPEPETPRRKSIAPPPEPSEEPVVQRVHQALVTDNEPEAPVSRQEIVRGFEYQKDQYVVLEEDELKAITPKTAQEMQILEFVKLNEIDPLFFESSYYVSPDKSGERPYSLLYTALKKSGSVALAEVAMHRREHVVVLRPGPSGIIWHTMFYTNEIRREEEFRTDVSGVNEKELNVAQMLIQSMTATFEPEKFKDKYRERLENLIEEKLAGRKVTVPTAPAKQAEVVDILAALQQSLNLMKKPVQHAAANKPAKRKRAS